MQANENIQHTISINGYEFSWLPASKLWRVSVVVKRTATIIEYTVCQVEPYKQEYHTDFFNSKKMYTVKAQDYADVGNLEQMVKGSDLLDYIDSIRMGRGM